MSELARAGGAAACVGLAALFVATRPRDRLAALLLAGAGTCALAAGLSSGQAPEAAAGGAVAFALGVGLAVLYRRLPWTFPALGLAVIPVRVGAVGHQLLVPLYVAILGAAVALGWELVRGDPRSRELGLASWPLAAYVGWTGLSMAWTNDVHTGGVELLAFVLPLSILALAVARLPWSRLWLRLLAAEAAVMAVVFAAVGFYQYDTRNIFENPKLHTSNAYAVFFRVNSIFWDPSVYGRFLVVAMLPAVVLIVRGRSPRLSVPAFLFLAVAWLGLLISYSQSSFAALLVAVAGVAAVAWRWRSVLALLVAAAVLAGLASAEPRLRHALVHHTTSGLNSATSGRASLVANGIRIAGAHPVLGVGVGGFKRAYAERLHLRTREPKIAASHDTPVTVAAETGIVGLALFAWLVVALLATGLRRIDRSFAGRASLTAALALAAILVHSLFYADFFEDPTTWLLFGLIALTAPRTGPAEEQPAAVENKEAVPV